MIRSYLLLERMNTTTCAESAPNDMLADAMVVPAWTP
jgi:hypothetical protein